MVDLPLTTMGFSSEPFVREDVDPEELGVDERSLSNTLDVIPGVPWACCPTKLSAPKPDV